MRLHLVETKLEVLFLGLQFLDLSLHQFELRVLAVRLKILVHGLGVLMLLQLEGGLESLVASRNITNKWFLLGVGLQMILQVGRSVEGLLTTLEGTFVKLLLFVNPLMSP